MFVALIIFHVLVCIALIIVVLLQSSKGEGLAGSAFGGGGGLGGAVFGGRGAGSFLSKATSVLAILFMLNCVGLAVMSSNRSGPLSSTGETGTGTESVITREAQRAREQAMQQQQQQQQQQSGDSLLNITPVTPQGQEGETQQPAPSGDGQ